MLRFSSFDIVFSEIPDEVTLAISLAGCPNNCQGCHSPWLREEVGEELTFERLTQLTDLYRSSITCLCLMGGDEDPSGVEKLLCAVRSNYPNLKVAWYSGREELPEPLQDTSFDYLKLGPYVEALGGLSSSTTNQRLYRIRSDGQREDLTARFWR